MRAQILTLAFVFAACGGPSRAPEGPAPAPAKKEEPGAPTAAAPTQVERGAALFKEHCASCHGEDGKSGKAPPLVGKDALPLKPRPNSKRNVDFATAGDVLRWVSKSMPGDDPGSLTAQQYADIVAFDLHANGVDMSKITLDEAKANEIKLH